MVITYAEVAVDVSTPHHSTFSYSVPESMDVKIGQGLWVPFGPRVIPGILFDLPSGPSVSQVRDILGPMDSDPLLSIEQLSLARWISDYYHCGLFQAAALMIPPDFRGKIVAVFEAKPNGYQATPSHVSHFQGRLLELLTSRGPTSIESLRRVMGPMVDNAAEQLMGRNLVTRSWTWRRPAAHPKYSEG